jgi:hypothetical protein
MNSSGTPWLMTLKNPNSSQALTMRCLESGLERSINGIPECNVAEMQFLMKEECSFGCRRVKLEEEEGYLFLIFNYFVFYLFLKVK